MRATREDSGWNTDDPSPTIAAAARIAGKLRAEASRSSPPSVHPMPIGERVRRRPPVGVDADHRLQQRRGQLERQRDQPDLPEVEGVGTLEDRVDRRQHRLQHVVQEMAEADRQQDAEDCACRTRHTCGGDLAGGGLGSHGLPSVAVVAIGLAH